MITSARDQWSVCPPPAHARKPPPPLISTTRAKNIARNAPTSDVHRKKRNPHIHISTFVTMQCQIHRCGAERRRADTYPISPRVDSLLARRASFFPSIRALLQLPRHRGDVKEPPTYQWRIYRYSDWARERRTSVITRPFRRP